MDRIDCLRAFVRALEGGSFSAAAAELGIGQPAVSRLVDGSNYGTSVE
jgi:DNA-binding transcriptional LysR family regulator